MDTTSGSASLFDKLHMLWCTLEALDDLHIYRNSVYRGLEGYFYKLRNTVDRTKCSKDA